MDEQSTVTEEVTPEQVTTVEVRGIDTLAVTVDGDNYVEYEIALDTEEDHEGKERKVLTSVFTKFTSWYRNEAEFKPVRLALTPRTFTRLVQEGFSRFMYLSREGLLNGQHLGYRLYSGYYGGTTDVISAVYAGRNERVLMLGGLRLQLTTSQFNQLLSKMQEVKTPVQRIEQGGTIEYNVTYSISHTVELEVDEFVDQFDAEEWTDPDTGIDYWLIEGTEQEVTDMFYDGSVEDAEMELPDRYSDWDYYEETERDFSGIPEVEEHESEEDDDEDE